MPKLTYDRPEHRWGVVFAEDEDENGNTIRVPLYTRHKGQELEFRNADKARASLPDNLMPKAEVAQKKARIAQEKQARDDARSAAEAAYEAAKAEGKTEAEARQAARDAWQAEWNAKKP